MFSKNFVESRKICEFKLSEHEKGQTLIAIAFLSIIALAIGIIVSNRFIGNLSMFSKSDNYSKAQAAADAAIENILLLPVETLESYIDYGNCGSACVLEIDDFLGQKIVANISLSYAGNSSDAYEMNLKQGEVEQLNLKDFPAGKSIDVCWNGETSIYANYIYEESSVIKSKVFAYNNTSYSGYENGFSQATARNGYSNCFYLTSQNTSKIVRLKPYYNDATVFILPPPDVVLPKQGIYIESIGHAGDATRKVSVLKTYPTAPEFFDYAIYQKSEEEPLSNRTY